MINSVEDLRSAGTLPSGPVSAWPKERNVAGGQMKKSQRAEPAKKIKASLGQMASGLAKSAVTAVKNGKVNPDIREARMDTCRACPSFLKDSERCSDCGCYLPVKAWLNGNPAELCPLAKWER